jgi:hypothetical protein
VFAVTLTAFVEAVESSVHVVSFTANVGAAPACVTEMVLVSALAPDPAVNVTVAVRVVVLVFPMVPSVTLRLPLPPVSFAVTHASSLVTVHVVLEVTLTAFVDAPKVASQAVSFTPNVGATPDCVTAIVLVVALAPDPIINVTVAVRATVLACAVALSVTLLSSLPPVALTVNHG